MKIFAEEACRFLQAREKRVGVDQWLKLINNKLLNPPKAEFSAAEDAITIKNSILYLHFLLTNLLSKV